MRRCAIDALQRSVLHIVSEGKWQAHYLFVFILNRTNSITGLQLPLYLFIFNRTNSIIGLQLPLYLFIFNRTNSIIGLQLPLYLFIFNRTNSILVLELQGSVGAKRGGASDWGRGQGSKQDTVI